MNKANERALKRILASSDVTGGLRSYLRTAAPMKPPKKPMQLAREREEKQQHLSRKAARAARRAEVFARAGGICELSGAPNPTEWHHLLSGIGRRQQMESVKNTMAVTSTAHQAYHRDPAAFAEVVAAWCVKHGYPPIKRIEHAALKRPNKTTGAASGRRPE